MQILFLSKYYKVKHVCFNNTEKLNISLKPNLTFRVCCAEKLLTEPMLKEKKVLISLVSPQWSLPAVTVIFLIFLVSGQNEAACLIAPKW